ncbi:hypothetical protein LTR96_003407 [Exophiala xenobiotica]|uniref:Uncharacterized protein n=1 Tax=Vermiconidia calcicola TaxID=1690605 RepID=A0AAV9QLL2_9PEZI|nr:hypothetical protein LTR96_003407 [Exophiala xenobiotica]KAK5434980.1 hypothetical protein LTR18_010079 [Exophiala xenobiotica]KAK5437788.1 hypothetical protein LTR34_001335 [Exophiala xenobiotica]KAK5545824.1 hypothetical protein LTR25_000834 [Vermiconidia calcicola]KAK5549915.1 hypothetical protein LTR23_000206 [Chaetothyriales sp. CCFEE 6169]
MFKLPEFPSNMPHDKTESRKATAHNHLWKIPAGVRGPETVHAFSCLPCLDSLSEREIENVNHRLASLEKILQASVRAQSGPQASPQTNSGAVPSPRDSQPAEREPDFAGSSSFVAQSKDVTQAFERSLGLANNTPSSAGDVSAAVATLRSFLYDKSASSDGTGAIPVHKPLQEAVHYPELANLELPSMQAVLKVLRLCKCRLIMPTNEKLGISSRAFSIPLWTFLVLYVARSPSSFASILSLFLRRRRGRPRLVIWEGISQTVPFIA